MTFTPGQREEALKWYAENCPESTLVMNFGTAHGQDIQDVFVDVYFKLKSIPFNFKPNEFIVGIEYKNEVKIRAGKEVPNVRIQNPHKKVAGSDTHDELALIILINLFKQAQI
jgi:hypothetical protein